MNPDHALPLPKSRNPRPPRPTAVVIGAIVGIYLLTAVPLIFCDRSGRAAADEANFHLPAIEQFARQWPRPDLSNYPSATTPGYHLSLAMVRRYVTEDVRLLRLAAAAFSVGFLATLAGAVARRVGAVVGVALCLPVVCSLYVLSSGVWLVPDNAGMWGVLGILLLSLRPRVDRWTYLAGGATLALLVSVRQIHLWTLAPLLAAAWLGTDGPRQRVETASCRWARLMKMATAALPAIALLAWLFYLWHGAMPPAARGLNAGINPAVAAFCFAIFGVFGLFYAPFLIPSLKAIRTSWRGITAAAVIGACTGLFTPTDYSQTAGRWSGLWNLARLFPTIGHRSPLIVILSALGAATIAAWYVALPRRDGRVLVVAVLAFIAAHTSTHEIYQRYYEPFALVFFALAAAHLPVSAQRISRFPLSAAGPCVLAAILAVITGWSLR